MTPQMSHDTLRRRRPSRGATDLHARRLTLCSPPNGQSCSPTVLVGTWRRSMRSSNWPSCSPLPVIDQGWGWRAFPSPHAFDFAGMERELLPQADLIIGFRLHRLRQASSRDAR